MIMCPRSSSFDGAVSVARCPSVPRAPISPSGIESPSRMVQSRLDDVGVRALESKLQLLHAQRELSALRCQAFIDHLESAFPAPPPAHDDRLGRRPPSLRARRASFDLSGAEGAQLAQELRFYEEPARVARSHSHSATASPAAPASRPRFPRSKSHRGPSGSSPSSGAFPRHHSSPAGGGRSPVSPFPPSRANPSHRDGLSCSIGGRASNAGARESFMASRRSLKDRPSSLGHGSDASEAEGAAQGATR
ncbi:hypothetical protein CLOM_g10298 [Closterium sp. NIES-68]|nr:hypothetical protein CLOM_g10298 [Closterium sp. NIES-68]GJP78137.1 hypothetical protein CLOP_g8470 [Closterium sp. NIES-67]